MNDRQKLFGPVTSLGGQPIDEPFVAVLNWFQELFAHLGE